MVNIFGMKFFESPSMEEQMHHKGRSHGSNCGCPNCSKKRYRGRSRRRFVSRRRFISRRHFKGGYIYNNKSMKEEDVTMELSNVLSGSKSRTKSKSRGTRRRRH